MGWSLVRFCVMYHGYRVFELELIEYPKQTLRCHFPPLPTNT